MSNKDDKFYIEGSDIEWVYYNPDSSAGGQYVSNNFGIDLIKKAFDELNIAEKVFDFIQERCTEYLIDIGTPLYKGYDNEFNHDRADVEGLDSQALIDLIHKTLLSKEIKNKVE